MSFYQDKKVFVAGGAGLIGQSLIRQLVPLGAKVTATEHRQESQLDKPRRIDPAFRDKIIVIENADFMTPYRSSCFGGETEIYRGYDFVFWAAAKVGGAKAIKEKPMELLHYNLELASRNIKAAVDAKVERFCYVSSSYVYPDFDMPAIEGDIALGDVPRVHYGLGWIKRFMEKLCMSHQLTSETRFAIVRPTAIYGPHDNFDLETCHVIPALIRKIVEGQNPLEVWGDGSEQRQFTYVDDLVRGMLLATANYACAEPINIATATVSTVNDVWRTLFDIEGLTHDCYDPVTGFFPPPRENLRGVFYRGDKPRAIDKRLVNCNLAAFRLGYECKTSLKDGLRQTVDWYRRTFS